MRRLATSEKGYKSDTYEIPNSELVAYYSIDEERRYVRGGSQLKFVRMVDLTTLPGLTLNLSPEEIYYPEVDHFPHFRHLLERRELIEAISADDVEECGFSMNGRSLKSAMNVPYEGGPFDGVPRYFSASLFRGVIYLTRDKRWPKGRETPRYSYRSYDNKILQHVLSESPDTPPNPDSDVRKLQNFYGLYDIKYKNHRILCKSSINGVLANKGNHVKKIDTEDEAEGVNQLKELDIVALRNVVYYFCANDYRHHYTRNVWIDCLLTNISKIFMIWRANEVVKKVDISDLNDLADQKMQWEPSTCVNFGAEFLSYVKECFKNKITEMGHTGSVKSLPRIDLVFKVENVDTPLPHITPIECSEEDRPPVLPDWYEEELSKK